MIEQRYVLIKICGAVHPEWIKNEDIIQKVSNDKSGGA